VIIGVVVAVVVVAISAGLVLFVRRRKKNRSNEARSADAEVLNRMGSIVSSINDSVNILMPPEAAPSAPPLNPAFSSK